MTKAQIMADAETFLAKNLPPYYAGENQGEKMVILLKEIGKVGGNRAREIENNLKQFSTTAVEGQGTMDFELYQQSNHWK